MASFLLPMVRNPQVTHSLINTRTGDVLARQLLPAFDSATRRKGLLGRDSLPDGVALVIAPSNAVHTFFMRFAIDIAFVGKDGRLLRIRHAVPRRRLAVALRGHAVIELAAGTLARFDLRPGDRLGVAGAARD